jgi:hypothetical protein
MDSFDHEYQNRNIDAKIVVALERISEAFKVLLWKEGKCPHSHSITIIIVFKIPFSQPVQSQLSGQGV